MRPALARERINLPRVGRREDDYFFCNCRADNNGDELVLYQKIIFILAVDTLELERLEFKRVTVNRQHYPLCRTT